MRPTEVSAARRRSQTEALAAFGATRRDHCATTTGFHAHQKAMRACAANFGRLICAFHDDTCANKGMKVGMRSSV
jgi:hypothetical protein